MKGDYMAKRSTFGSIKKRFSDITNSLPQHNSPAIVKTVPPDSSPDKDLVDKLTNENLALFKLIQDKNKVIDMKGTELHINRINLQKIQSQNWNLAKVNSQMMVELNLAKIKLKSLQHELSCKEALLKAMHEDLKKVEVVIPADTKAEDESGKLTTNHSRCHGLPRSRSLSQAISNQQGADKDATESKRRCVRRQSTNSRTQHQTGTTIGKLLEIEVTNFSPESTHFHRHEKDGFGLESRQTERSSIGRPMRKAAEKVQSYKEIPLNIKMRRND